MEKRGNVLKNLKQKNRNKIYNCIRREGSISGPNLIYELKLSRPTITQNLSELLADGLIIENGYFGYTGGRKAKAYSINENKGIAFGLDITKRYITVVVVNLNDKVIYEKQYRQDFSETEEYFQRLGEIINLAVEEIAIDKEKILGVGVAIPAIVSSDYQNIIYGVILNFEKMSVKKLSEYIPYKCRLYNEASAGGYAEMSQYDNIDNAFYFCLSNNIGGAVFINNNVYNGDDFRSGEIGHITIDVNGEECYCGKRGCFETLCNARILSEPYDGNLKLFFENLENGDSKCIEIWKKYLEDLSVAVNNVHMLYDCKIILGGYVGAYMEKYMEDIRKLAAARNTFNNKADYLYPCKVKKDVQALGAALPFIHEFRKMI